MLNQVHIKSSNNIPHNGDSWETATHSLSVSLSVYEYYNLLSRKHETKYTIQTVVTNRATNEENLSPGFQTKSLERANIAFINRYRELKGLPRLMFTTPEGKALNPLFLGGETVDIIFVKRGKRFVDIEYKGQAYRVNRYGVVCKKSPLTDNPRKFWYSFTSWNDIDFQTCADIRDSLATHSEFKKGERDRTYFYKSVEPTGELMNRMEIIVDSVAKMQEADKYTADKKWVLQSECPKTRKLIFIRVVN